MSSRRASASGTGAKPQPAGSSGQSRSRRWVSAQANARLIACRGLIPDGPGACSASTRALSLARIVPRTFAFAFPFGRHETDSARLCGTELVDHGLLVGLGGMEFEAEVAELTLLQPVIDHLERRHLLGDEEHPTAKGEVVSDDVADGLGFAGTGRWSAP